MNHYRLVLVPVVLLVAFVGVSAVLAAADVTRERTTYLNSSQQDFDFARASFNFIEHTRPSENSIGQQNKTPHSEPANMLPLASIQIDVNYKDDWVAGVAGAPASVMVTVTHNGGEIKETATVVTDGFGDFAVGCDDWDSGNCPDIIPGDRVYASVVGALAEIDPVGAITGIMDPESDTVTGTLHAGWFTGTFEVQCEIWEDSGPTIALTADTGGEFICNFADQWDLQQFDQVALRYYEPDGDSVINVLPWPWMRVNYAHDWVGGDYEIDHTVFYTLTESDGVTVKSQGTADTTGSGGWSGPGFQSENWGLEHPDIVPGDVVFFETDDGYTNSVQAGWISGTVDLEDDHVRGTIVAPGPVQSLAVECHPWGAWSSGIDAPEKVSAANSNGTSEFLCQWDPSTEWDMELFQEVAVMYIEDDGDRVIDVLNQQEVYQVELGLNPQGDSSMWGEALNGPVTVTTPYTEHHVYAEPGCDGCWNVENAGPIFPSSDVITVEAGRGQFPVSIEIIDPFNVEVDTGSNNVSGEIGGWINQPVEVFGYWENGHMQVESDGSGFFSANYPDIPRGASGEVRIDNIINYTDISYHRPFRSLDLLLEVNYSENWVGGLYAPGQTVWITVTESDRSTVKGLAELSTGEIPGWDGQTGFSTDLPGWTGPTPNILPYDWVFGQVDNGYTSEVQVGEIFGTADFFNDNISGYLDVDWLVGFADFLEILCHPWGAWGSGIDAPVKFSIASPNGSIPYFCEWDPTTEWDMPAGQHIGIKYIEPDGDSVMRAFLTGVENYLPLVLR